MQYKTISYHKVFNLGNYSNEKIGVEIEVGEGENPVECHAEAVRYVERAHKFQKEFPTYEKAKRILADPDNYTGIEVKQAKQAVEVFENNFSEQLKSFFPNLQPQLSNASEDDLDLPY